MPPLLCFSLWVWVQSALLFLVKQNLHRTRRPAMFCILHHIETDSPTFISHYLFHSFILLYTIYIYYSPRYIHTKYYFKIIWITCFRQSSCIFKTLDIFSMLSTDGNCIHIVLLINYMLKRQIIISAGPIQITYCNYDAV